MKPVYKINAYDPGLMTRYKRKNKDIEIIIWQSMKSYLLSYNEAHVICSYSYNIMTHNRFNHNVLICEKNDVSALFCLRLLHYVGFFFLKNQTL